MQVTFAFEIDQRVRITASAIEGTVRGFYIDRDQIKSVWVIYFLTTGEKKHDYFREDEITAVPA